MDLTPYLKHERIQARRLSLIHDLNGVLFDLKVHGRRADLVERRSRLRCELRASLIALKQWDDTHYGETA